jgi:hypothetical protein
VSGEKIESIGEFLTETQSDCEKWGLGKSPWFPWFRGEPSCDTPLLPKLYRKKYQMVTMKIDFSRYSERKLLECPLARHLNVTI